MVKIFEDLGKSFVAPTHSVKCTIAVEVGLPGAPKQGKLIEVSIFFLSWVMLHGVFLIMSILTYIDAQHVHYPDKDGIVGSAVGA